jgi:hypothetical protein
MIQAGWLFGLAGVVSFIGFLMVAVGTAQEIPLFTPNFGFGTAFVSGLVPWGIGVIGLGVMLGFFGAAVKGPSVEWRDIKPEPEMAIETGPRPPGTRFACPGCGGDVYTGQASCHECGCVLQRAQPSSV